MDLIAGRPRSREVASEPLYQDKDQGGARDQGGKKPTQVNRSKQKNLKRKS